jgi:hypothetical protein
MVKVIPLGKSQREPETSSEFDYSALSGFDSVLVILVLAEFVVQPDCLKIISKLVANLKSAYSKQDSFQLKSWILIFIYL